MPLTWCIPSLSFQVARPTYIITVDKCCFHSMIFYNLLSVVSSITYAVLNYFLRHPASKACWDLEKCLCWKTQLNGERKCLIYLWCIIQKKYAQLWSICWSMLSCAVFEFLVHKKQLFCGPITLTSKALLDMAVGISFRKSKKWSKESFQGGEQPKIKLLVRVSWVS